MSTVYGPIGNKTSSISIFYAPGDFEPLWFYVSRTLWVHEKKSRTSVSPIPEFGPGAGGANRQKSSTELTERNNGLDVTGVKLQDTIVAHGRRSGT